MDGEHDTQQHTGLIECRVPVTRAFLAQARTPAVVQRGDAVLAARIGQALADGRPYVVQRLPPRQEPSDPANPDAVVYMVYAARVLLADPTLAAPGEQVWAPTLDLYRGHKGKDGIWRISTTRLLRDEPILGTADVQTPMQDTMRAFAVTGPAAECLRVVEGSHPGYRHTISYGPAEGA